MGWPKWIKKGRRRVTGYVDTCVQRADSPLNLDANVYLKATYAPEVIGMEIRRRFITPVGLLCIRPDHNSNPNDFIIVPPDWYEFLRVGDKVTVWISDEGQNEFCWGTMVELVEFEGQPCDKHHLIPNEKRPHWMKFREEHKLQVGTSYLDDRKPNSRFLKFISCLPGKGDGLICVAGPGVGKSTMTRNVISETDPEVWIIYIAAERGEDLLKFTQSLGNRPNLEVFSCPETVEAIRKLHIVELGINRAMRIAERGTPEKPVHVLIVMDSITKGIMIPINGLPSPIKDVGIGSGGTSPILEDVVTMVMGLRGNFGYASISEYIVVLNIGDTAASKLVNIVQSISTAHIYLAEEVPFYPKIVLNAMQNRLGNTIPASRARWMEDHVVDKGFVRAAKQLREKLSVTRILEDKKNAAANDSSIRYNRDTAEAAARFEVEMNVQVLLDLISQGLPDAVIFGRMGVIYTPDLPASAPVVASAAAPVRRPVLVPAPRQAQPAPRPRPVLVPLGAAA